MTCGATRSLDRSTISKSDPFASPSIINYPTLPSQQTPASIALRSHVLIIISIVTVAERHSLDHIFTVETRKIDYDSTSKFVKQVLDSRSTPQQPGTQLSHAWMKVLVFIVLAVYQLYLNQWLQIRWRKWLTTRYLGQWLNNATHYRMQLQGDAADNPDQRMTEDVELFVVRTLSISIGLLSSVVTLASFIIILWGLSNAAPLVLFGQDIDIPGYLVWGALIYAILGTALTHWIGKPLVALNFSKQRYEADFRFNLVRVRENSEQIALLRGDNAEQVSLSGRFARVVDNWLQIMSRTKRLTAFTASYSQASVVFPYILVAPAYFGGKIQLGGMMQTASAFGSVQTALSFFITAYT
ncbi:MAG: ABC transporter ATP-binding protein/permease, partial [Cytophagaceae bacterium]